MTKSWTIVQSKFLLRLKSKQSNLDVSLVTYNLLSMKAMSPMQPAPSNIMLYFELQEGKDLMRFKE